MLTKRCSMFLTFSRHDVSIVCQESSESSTMCIQQWSSVVVKGVFVGFLAGPLKSAELFQDTGRCLSCCNHCTGMGFDPMTQELSTTCTIWLSDLAAP